VVRFFSFLYGLTYPSFGFFKGRKRRIFLFKVVFITFDPNRKKWRALLFWGEHMNKNTLARHSCSAEWVKEELTKFMQVTDPKQVEKIRLYMGIGKLTESFKTFFVPTGVAAPEEVWASQTNPHLEWSEVYHIKIRDRNDWQLFDCPVCGHEIMLRTQHDIGTEIKPIPPNGECDYCKTKFPNQTVRKPHLGKRNAEYKATRTIM
jgi:hypothetical protein